MLWSTRKEEDKVVIEGKISISQLFKHLVKFKIIKYSPTKRKQFSESFYIHVNYRRNHINFNFDVWGLEKIQKR